MTKNGSRRLVPGIAGSLILLLPLLGTAAAPTRLEQPPAVGSPKAFLSAPARGPQAYGTLPLSFEVNRGQTDGQVKFLSRGMGYTLFLTSTEAVFLFAKREASAKRPGLDPMKPHRAQPNKMTRTVVRMKLVDANPDAHVAGLEELPGKTNYFKGSDKTKWRTNVSTYARVEYRDVYPGVNLVYYGNQRQLEYDFIMGPGSDPNAVRLAFEGVEQLTLDARGDLILHTAVGEIRQKAPHVYQTIGGERRDIPGRYVLHGERRVGFHVAAYDRTKPLVIDPVLSYSTYLHSPDGDDENTSLAVDASGNAYLTGHTSALDFPTVNAVQPASGGLRDIFVSKLNPGGSALVYSTYLGGSDEELGRSIAVDASGNAYVTGDTTSTDFPTVNAVQPTLRGFSDAFVVKLDPTGAALVYSTYLGGTGLNGQCCFDEEQGAAVAVDASGNAYVTGLTSSPDFPTVNPIKAVINDFRDAFVTKLDSAGAFVYSTYLGGNSEDAAFRIAVDASGHAYVTGWTFSIDFPTVNPLQSALSGFVDAFVSKLNPAGSAFVYSTYLGGSDFEIGKGIAVDASGNAYVTGGTGSIDFPTVNPSQSALSGISDAFVSKLNPTGSALVYSTYLGGGDSDFTFGIAVDAAGNAYVAGETNSSDFPTVSPLQPVFGGIVDAYVTKVDPSGAFAFSTYLGGSDQESDPFIAVDASGNVYVAGTTQSTDFPTVNPLQPQGVAASQTVFVAKLNASLPSVNTPAGSTVTVPLGSGASVSFPSISTQGDTTVTTSSTGPAPPSGFSLGTPPTYYDVTTTATFGGPVMVCIKYDPTQFSDPTMLRLLHFEGNAWVDVTTSANTDISMICGQVTGFSLFAITESAVMRVNVDIKPGSSPNSINLGSGGTVPVAIFSTPSFDARTVDPLSVTLASAPVKLKGKGTPMASFQDVNGDGLVDLVVHVETEALEVSATDTMAVLDGQTFGGDVIRGTDSVRVVP